MARPWEVSADDIVAWASSATAAVTLPKLVRRLLFATAPLRSIVMRADAGIHFPGWDGVVESTRDTAFCPAGTSYWELSVDAEVKSKLERDFQKRIERGTADAATTYVAVTARRFSGKAKWVQDKQRQGAFADVAVLDADDLATWLEQTPPVARWFASTLDRPAAGADDLDTFLDLWERRTDPPLRSALALAGRERAETAARVRSWLTAPGARPFAVRGDTREEVLVFVAAAIVGESSPEAEQWRSRALIVKDLETWTWLTSSQHAEPPILLPAFPQIDRGHAERAASSIKAHVLLPLDGSAPMDTDAEMIEPIPHPEIADQLKQVGIAEAEADRLARESGGRLPVLQRLFGHVATPDWVVAADLPPLLAMLLAGAWDPASDADREVIRRMGADPRAVEDLCARLLRRPDAPIEREVSWGGRGRWGWVAPADAWRALARHLNDSHLTSFRDMAIDVLGERDPRYEMPKGERLYAAVRGKVPGRSGHLRVGIAESLVRLALSDPELRASFQTSRGSQTAELVVSRVLDAAGGWQAWASLSNLLPVLAEAAPSMFLRQVERSLDQGSDGVGHVLQEEEMDRSPHTGLLWALETLGWNPELMPRAAYALARLAAVDPPEAKLANRPLGSLRNLLHPLLPQSLSTVEQRIQILSTLLERRESFGDVGWKMTAGQYANIRGPGVMFLSHLPQYRPWAIPSEQHESSQSDVKKQLTAMLDLLLQHVDAEPARWKDLLDPLWRLPAEWVSRILDQLGHAMSAATDPHGVVWASLRDLLSSGYRFGEAGNIRPELLRRVAQLYGDLEPADKVTQLAWLFDNRTNIPEPLKDVSESHSRRFELQRLAVADLWRNENRLELLARLATVAIHTYAVGYALGVIADPVLDEHLLIGSADERLSSLLPGFVWSRAQTAGTDWAIRVLKELVDRGRRKDALSIALVRSAEPVMWDTIDSIGEPFRSELWAQVDWLSREYSKSDADRALENLVNARNIVAAANFAGYHPEIVEPRRALEILEALRRLDDSQFEPFVRDSSAAYVIEHLFAIIDRDPSLDINAVVQLEVFFLPLLEESQRGARHLSTALEKDAASFVSLLMARYRDEREIANPLQAGEEGSGEADVKARRAETAYKILSGWHKYPGIDLLQLSVNRHFSRGHVRRYDSAQSGTGRQEVRLRSQEFWRAHLRWSKTDCGRAGRHASCLRRGSTARSRTRFS